VRFVGRRQDVPEVLRSLDVLVNASEAEPFGLSVLEAQASGVAVVGTDAGGIPDFVEHGVTGLLVPPDDASAMADALGRLVADADLRRRLAEAGRRQAIEHFALDDQYDRRAAVYHAAAASGRGRRAREPAT
jgi:glycosyltransferase involved in cell wall biosynthesis